ncbi:MULTISPECIES: hypothetical protein [Pseudomonadaceae]
MSEQLDLILARSFVHRHSRPQ